MESANFKAVLRAKSAKLRPAMKARERHRGMRRWNGLLPDERDKRLKMSPDDLISDNDSYKVRERKSKTSVASVWVLMVLNNPG